MAKILLTLANDMIAPRFDFATEVLIVAAEKDKIIASPRSVLLPGPSADELCNLILKEDITALICGGIEDEHYQYLSWKKVKVVDRVIGEARLVLQEFLAGNLHEGAVLKGATGPGGGEGEKISAAIE